MPLPENTSRARPRRGGRGAAHTDAKTCSTAGARVVASTGGGVVVLGGLEDRVRRLTAPVLVAAFLVLVTPSEGFAQEAGPPTLRAGTGGETIRIDGVLDEEAWGVAQRADAFLQIDPAEGAPPTFRTVVRVLASGTALIIGVVCYDPEIDKIVSFSIQRDAALNSEDHIRVILGPFRDGRSGYVFAINAGGARYDALINLGAQGENAGWDGIWEAATAKSPDGWSAEIRIPSQTVTFKPGLHEWHFNVQRHVQRLLETTRWAFPTRQHQVTQTSRAGLLTDLPEFALGRGLTIRPGATTGGGVPAPEADVEGEFQPSLDITQRLGSNVLTSLTVNTDFAEADVDTRRTNLTRFPLFFPEKRTFFLEGSDTFLFGPLPNRDVIPFFSRRIGLVNGREVPVLAGAKVDGRAANTNFGALVVGTGIESGVVDDRALMAVARLKQNIWRESAIGAIATFGDPLGRTGSWLGGLDFSYATTRFRGDQNFTIGFFLLAAGRDGLPTDTAQAFKIDYPNDTWDLAFWYKRIGPDFDPSLGFVPRRGVQLWNQAMRRYWRPTGGPIQEIMFAVRPFIATDLSHEWESYNIQIQAINWLFRSGERIQVHESPVGERLDEPFEVAPDVIIPPGSYTWRRHRFILTTAEKRRLAAEASWVFGGFYDGDLDQFSGSLTWNPTPLYTLEFSGEHNVGRLESGRFTQTLVGTRLSFNFSPDLSLTSYAQYDTDSDSIGTNTRLRWTFLPVADLFIVYNHNVHSLLDRWQTESNQLLIKVQYAWRM